MNNVNTSYKETHRLPINVYLLFYVYVFVLIIISNLLSPSTITYFIYLIAGIAGICILFINATYTIAIKENTFSVFIKIPFRIRLFVFNIDDILFVEKTGINSFTNKSIFIKRSAGIYAFEKKDGIKLTLADGRTFIISGIDADKIISLLNK